MTDQPTPTAKTIALSKCYPAQLIPVDTDEGLSYIAVRAKRLNHGELAECLALTSTVIGADEESLKALYRKPDTDEHAKDDAGAFVIDEVEIRRRRLDEMTADDRAAHLALERREVDARIAAASTLIGQWLEVAPKWPDGAVQTVEYEGEVVRTGADLVRMFGGNMEMTLKLAGIVSGENTISAEKKRRLLRPFASSIGSPSNPPDAGATPAETAANADPSACAASESVAG